MAQRSIEVQVSKREPGKSDARALRRKMRTPGVVYGAVVDSSAIEVDERDVMKYYASAYDNAIITLKSDNSKLNNVPVIMKWVDIHPVTRKPVHVDFHALNMKSKLVVDVEIKPEGTPKGAEDGGILQVVQRYIEVECLPTDIPESLKVDVSGLEVGDSIHVSDLTFPPNVVAVTSSDTTLMTLSVPEEQSTETAEATSPADVPATSEKTEEESKEKKE